MESASTVVDVVALKGQARRLLDFFPAAIYMTWHQRKDNTNFQETLALPVRTRGSVQVRSRWAITALGETGPWYSIRFFFTTHVPRSPRIFLIRKGCHSMQRPNTGLKYLHDLAPTEARSISFFCALASPTRPVYPLCSGVRQALAVTMNMAQECSERVEKNPESIKVSPALPTQLDLRLTASGQTLSSKLAGGSSIPTS